MHSTQHILTPLPGPKWREMRWIISIIFSPLSMESRILAILCPPITVLEMLETIKACHFAHISMVPNPNPN